LIPQEQFVAIANDIWAAMALIFGQQCHHNPPRLILAEQLGGRASARLILEIDIGKLLAVVVADAKAGV
jgi:hypothetical protein